MSTAESNAPDVTLEFKPMTDRERVELTRKAPTALQRGAELRETLAPHMPRLLQNLLNAALKGDMQASRLLVERYWAVPRPPAANPGIKIDTSLPLVQQAQQVVTELAGGADIDAGAAVISALSTAVKLAETADLAARLDQLEQAAAPPPARTATVMPLRAVVNGVDISDLA